MNEDEQAGAEPSAAANVEPREAGAQGSLQVKRGSGGGWEVKQVVLVGATAATVVVSLLVFLFGTDVVGRLIGDEIPGDPSYDAAAIELQNGNRGYTRRTRSSRHRLCIRRSSTIWLAI